MLSTGTTLFYNGVLMRDCQLNDWSQEIVRDESSTDVLYSKVRLSIESTLVTLFRPGYTDADSSPPGGKQAPLSTIAVPLVASETVVDRWHEVQWRLQESRGDFWLALNAVTKQPGGDVPENDASNNASFRVVLAATGLQANDAAAIKDDPNASLGKLSGFSDFGLGTPRLEIERKDVIDLNNGPKVIAANVTKAIGGRSLRVQLVIEVCRCFCRPLRYAHSDPYNSGSIPPVLDAAKAKGVISNRWSLTESLDDQWRTTHAIEGKLHVSDARYKPHAMRMMVTPKLFPYGKMTGRTYATDRTGLTLAYRFDIRETGPAAPIGVADWSGRYEEQSINGGKNLATIVVKLTGYVSPTTGGLAEPNAPDPHQLQKQRLLDIAQKIVRARVSFSRLTRESLPGSDPDAITITDMLVVEQMDKPIVEMRCSFMYADKADLNNGGQAIVSGKYGLRLKNMGKSIASAIEAIDPEYSPQWWRSPDPFPWDIDSETAASEDDYGTYFDCYFQSPCSEWHGMPRGAIPPDSVERETGEQGSDANPTGPAEGFGVPGATLLYIPNMSNSDIVGEPEMESAHWWNDNQAAFPYYQASVDTEYLISSGKIQVGLSKPRQLNGYGAEQTSATVRLHAGVSQRVVTVIATREGDWPEVPQPTELIVNTAQSQTVIEEFLDGKIVADAPKLKPEGKGFLYSLQVRWVYSITRTPTGSDLLKIAKDPRDKTTPDRNHISLTKYFKTGVYY